MNINNLKANKIELQECLKLILQIPEKLNKIDIDQKKELIIEIDLRILNLRNTINDLINANDNYYLYPESYLPDRLFEYWAERTCQQFYFNELEFLKKLIAESIEPLELEGKYKNPYPLLFINFEVYSCFLKYTENHIIEFYSDYSYLKKRLEKENLIHYHKDNDFIKVLFNEMKIIKKSDFDNYTMNQNKLKSLSKSYNIQRVNNFNNVFKSLV